MPIEYTQPADGGIKLVDVPWDYTLYKRDDTYVLNVICTSWVNRSAQWDIDHVLTSDEVKLYQERGQPYLVELKKRLAEASEQAGFDNWAKAHPKLAKGLYRRPKQ